MPAAAAPSGVARPANASLHGNRAAQQECRPRGPNKRRGWIETANGGGHLLFVYHGLRAPAIRISQSEWRDIGPKRPCRTRSAAVTVAIRDFLPGRPPVLYRLVSVFFSVVVPPGVVVVVVLSVFFSAGGLTIVVFSSFAAGFTMVVSPPLGGLLTFTSQATSRSEKAMSRVWIFMFLEWRSLVGTTVTGG